MFSNPNVRAWLYILGFIVVAVVFVLGVLGVVSKESLMNGFELAALFVSGCLMLLARYNTPTG